jgi:Subtilase family
MRIKSVIFSAIFLAALATPVAAWDTSRSIVRIKSNLVGRTVMQSICAQLQCEILHSLDTLPGDTGPSSLFVVRNLPAPSLSVNYDLLGIEAVEADLPAWLAEDDTWGVSQATAAVLDALTDHTPATYYGSTAWQSYLGQPASTIVRASDAHCTLRATGGGTVAIVDTGADIDHPTLAPVLTAGYDFTRDVDGGDEKADVGGSPAGAPDGVYGVNQATAAVLDQATAAVLDDSTLADFGHGTMVAGVVHLVAPTARIMPLKAFASDGTGYTSDIIRAIVYAARSGANVLNMSFSRRTPSPELERAIDNAASLGVIAVASAGNDGRPTLMYPAAYDNVMGVASTADDDARSSFSNYGSDLVWVAAPGEGIVTTYPWGTFAGAWGTSFSAPMVSGAAALLVGLESTATYDQVSSAVADAQPLTADLGYGRLDLYRAVSAGRGLWPDAAESPIPDSCDSSHVDWATGP